MARKLRRASLFPMILLLLLSAGAASARPITDHAESDLVFLRGTVSSDGTVLAGSGFTVTRNACGSYTVTYDTPFGGLPTVTLGLRHGGLGNEGLNLAIEAAIIAVDGRFTYDQNRFTVFINQPIEQVLSGSIFFGANVPQATGGIIFGNGVILDGSVGQPFQPPFPITTDGCRDRIWGFIVVGPPGP